MYLKEAQAARVIVEGQSPIQRPPYSFCMSKGEERWRGRIREGVTGYKQRIIFQGLVI